MPVLGQHFEKPRWEQVEAWARNEIETLRNRLETPQSDELTAQVRGEIRALRRLLLQGEPPVPVDPKQQVQPQNLEY